MTTVAQLIAYLKTQPEDANVFVQGEVEGTFQYEIQSIDLDLDECRIRNDDINKSKTIYLLG